MKSDRELKQIGIETANTKLSDKEFERWKELRRRDLFEEADSNQEQINKEDEEAFNILVNSDTSELNTEVEIFGNDLEIRLDLSRKQRGLLREFQNLMEDKDVDSFKESKIRELENIGCELFAETLRKFNGKRIQKSKRLTLAKTCLEKWNLRGMTVAVRKIMTAIAEQEQEKREAVEKFR